jgi:3-oxoacyl-[acyl-carrier protein] reductase
MIQKGLHGRTALITGAGRGLGRSIAGCLQREGARIIAVSRGGAPLRQALEDLGGSTAGHIAIELDLEAPDAPAALLERLGAERPDIVVHNVGGSLNVSDPFCPVEDWRRVMRLNVEVAVELNRVLVPAMQERRWGRVCHIASIAGLENQGPPSYCASKAALIAYVRSVGRYVAKDGVVMTSVLPGAVFTEGGYWDDALRNRPDHVSKYLTERMAIQRFGEADEIGELVAFLCSNAASFCVGTAVLADGGQGRVFFPHD